MTKATKNKAAKTHCPVLNIVIIILANVIQMSAKVTILQQQLKLKLCRNNSTQ
jgi:hypothetical protein